MKNFVIAFFMAWGNFITLPCPYKRWDSALKNRMLAFLPSIGAVIGLLWLLLIFLMRMTDYALSPLMRLTISGPVGAVIATFFIFAICGFMHLDGFMDCNDAILSRRPLERRQEILKDSTVGAFAVVTVVFLLGAWFVCAAETWGSEPLALFFLIPVLSRTFAGAAILCHKPIGHSQYVTDFREKGKGKYLLAMLLQLALAAVIAVLISSAELQAVIAIFVVMALASICSGSYARAQLGGMSGDIAGYMICWSELAAILAMAVL